MGGVKVRFALSVFVLLCVAGLSARRAEARQALEGRGRSAPIKKIKYHGDMAGFLWHVAETYGVTIGLEVEPAQPWPVVQLELDDPTLRDVLEAVTRSAPQYAWREADGAVDVYPVSGGSTVLDTVISRLVMRNLSWAGASFGLLSTPEMRAGMAAAGLTHREDARASQDPCQFTMEMERFTARMTLHAITKACGGHFWMFRRAGGAGEYFSISNSTMK